MIKRLLANLFDEVLVVAISAVLLGVIILIMKLIGFKFTQPFYVAVVIAAIVNLLYYPITQGKFEATVGQKLLQV